MCNVNDYPERGGERRAGEEERERGVEGQREKGRERGREIENYCRHNCILSVWHVK